jgi:hypothetical protein
MYLSLGSPAVNVKHSVGASTHGVALGVTVGVGVVVVVGVGVLDGGGNIHYPFYLHYY